MSEIRRCLKIGEIWCTKDDPTPLTTISIGCDHLIYKLDSDMGDELHFPVSVGEVNEMQDNGEIIYINA